jgi:hypothetical protein
MRSVVSLKLNTFNAFSNKKLVNSFKLFSTTLVDNTEPKKLLGAEELLKLTDIFIFDCDGVIWYTFYTVFS